MKVSSWNWLARAIKGDVDRLLQFPDEDVGELDRVAVVLQGDLPAGGNVGKLGVLDDRLPVEDDGQAVALHRDDEAVPLAERSVGLELGRDAGTNLGRLVRVRAVAVHLA